ncbi:MAG: rod shape-determining protein MreC [Planctomycetaceae bacterium]|nr:rod shape-determining protein MreC [Planctomycetaceae bacterium]
MNRLPRLKPQLVLLIGIWGTAAAGLTVPGRFSEPLRTAVADALRPGRTAAVTVSEQGEKLLARFRAAPADNELLKLREEVALLRAHTQQDRAAQLGGIQQASAESDAGDPLLVADVVPATILGREPDVLRNRFARMLNRGTTSAVVVDDLVLADDGLHLDRGADDGIEAGHPAISGQVVVGTIRQAGRWTSTLQLITDPAYRNNVQLVRDSRDGPVQAATGVLRGNGDGSCVIELVPNSAAVSIGDFVYSRQQDADPTGPFYFGRVVEADCPPGADDWSIRVAPAFDAATLNVVQILQVSLNPERIGDPAAASPLATNAAATAVQ